MGLRCSIKFRKIVIGENQTFLGAEEWLRTQGVQLDVVQDDECIEMMRKFIAERRNFGMRTSPFRREKSDGSQSGQVSNLAKRNPASVSRGAPAGPPTRFFVIRV